MEQQHAKADTAKAAVNAAKAEITQIQAQLADSRNQRSKAEIVAPADGIIMQRNFVIEKRTQGVERLTALIQSGAERVRPIIMTTIAMVAGMLPAVFASGSGAAFRAPMAIAVICGLIASTLLSLIFVPVVYSLMDDFRNWLAPKMAKLTSVTKEEREQAERE